MGHDIRGHCYVVCHSVTLLTTPLLRSLPPFAFFCLLVHEMTTTCVVFLRQDGRLEESQSLTTRSIHNTQTHTTQQHQKEKQQLCVFSITPCIRHCPAGQTPAAASPPQPTASQNPTHHLASPSPTQRRARHSTHRCQPLAHASPRLHPQRQRWQHHSQSGPVAADSSSSTTTSARVRRPPHRTRPSR